MGMVSLASAQEPPAAATPAATPATTASAPTAAPAPSPATTSASADAAKPDAARPGEETKPSDAAKPTDASAIKVERTASGAKLFRITEGLVVEGQMQKPAAFYVLRRAAIAYDYAELGKSFLPKIGAAVKAPPF